MSVMDRNIAIRSALVASAAFALQGCVAAAFPVLAGGLMAGEGRSNDASEADIAQSTAPTQQEAPAVIPEVTESTPPAIVTAPATTPEPVAPAASAQVIAPASSNVAASTPGTLNDIEPEQQTVAAPVRIVSSRPSSNVGLDTEAAVSVTDAGPSLEPALDDASTAMAAAEAVSIPEPPAVPAPAPAPTPANADVQPAAEPVVIAEAAAAAVPISPPSTGGLVPIQEAAPATAGGTFFDPLFNYAASPGFVGTGDRTSAILVDALGLSLDREKCGDGRSTVLIDLDPADGKLFPIDTRSASTALARRLADLRLIGVTIAWISQNNIEKEQEIRSALRISGLDPLANDRLLLIRNSDERKQLRREQLAGTSCLIAIAGDERSDFHELYDYLLNPTDAQALEPLIGEGWFLIPTPLISERPQ